MSDRRKKEVIGLLTHSISTEKAKSGGGNTKLIEDLEKKLQAIKDGKNKGIRSRGKQ